LGLSGQEIALNEADEQPFRARREWTSTREEKAADHQASLRWDADIKVNHTPG
jgi:hypothetical protein